MWSYYVKCIIPTNVYVFFEWEYSSNQAYFHLPNLSWVLWPRCFLVAHAACFPLRPIWHASMNLRNLLANQSFVEVLDIWIGLPSHSRPLFDVRQRRSAFFQLYLGNNHLGLHFLFLQIFHKSNFGGFSGYSLFDFVHNSMQLKFNVSAFPTHSFTWCE